MANIMSFEEFAVAVRTTGAINRWPRLGDNKEVVTYSVYLNGPIAAQLAPQHQEHEFKDVMLHALTEKLWLNPHHFRDNLKIAELVAIRGSWMAHVLDTSLVRDEGGNVVPLPDRVIEDFDKLKNGLTHPWILEQIDQQQRMSLGLRPALDEASAALGKPVFDKTPDEISLGKVVAQNKDFTVQETHGGEIVTHENRRLNDLPSVGQNVLVSYYRGQGKVLVNRDLSISDPFIDPETKDLAVNLTDKTDGTIKETILFNSIASIAKFQEAEELDKSFVTKAMDVRSANPKDQTSLTTYPKHVISDVYIDDQSKCLAVDYEENGLQYTSLFGSADAMVEHGPWVGVTPEHIKAGFALERAAKQVERESRLSNDIIGKESLNSAKTYVEGEGLKNISPNLEKASYTGSVVAVTSHHVVQNIGARTAVIHDKRDLDKVPGIGDKLSVKYEGLRAYVQINERGQGRVAER